MQTLRTAFLMENPLIAGGLLFFAATFVTIISGCGATANSVGAIDGSRLIQTSSSVKIEASHQINTRKSLLVTRMFIDNDARLVEQAIGLAILNHQMFESVVTDNAGYEIQAKVMRLTQVPSNSLSITANAVIDWKCTDLISGVIEYEGRLSTRETVALSDELAGGTRQVKAYEGAVRNNIQQALEEFSQALSRSSEE